MDAKQVIDKSLSVLQAAGPELFGLEQNTLAEEFAKRNAEILQHVDDIQQVSEMWSDRPSQIQYKNFLTYALQSKFHLGFAAAQDYNLPADMFQQVLNNLPAVVAKNGLKLPELIRKDENQTTKYHSFVCTFGFQQYRYPKWVEVTPDDVFIDCGAFIGDTALWALQKGATVHSFEPIKANVEDMQLNLERNGYASDKCYNLAVGSENTEITIRMPQHNPDCSFVPLSTPTCRRANVIRLNESDTIELKVQCVRLDDYLTQHNITPTFIKMDIEGAELDALQGAAETIKTHKPKLAICLYHSDADLWAIPLFLKSLVPEYKFFCRENDVASEFVMYATVEDKH